MNLVDVCGLHTPHHYRRAAENKRAQGGYIWWDSDKQKVVCEVSEKSLYVRHSSIWLNGCNASFI